ncbi:MAG: hypothetical protein AB7K52_04265 [Phycisphaerales bacterium]
MNPRTGFRSVRRAPAAAAAAAALAAAAGLAPAAFAQDVTRPGDAIAPFTPNHPAGEPPAAAIDNTAATKYLHFDELNTGFTVTPTGTGIVRGLLIVTANDAPERDPTSFILEGSDDGVNFTMIASGALNPTTDRRSIEAVRFNNATAYMVYRVTFPTVRNAAAANSMQVAEVQLVTATDVLTPGDAFTVTYTPGQTSPPNEGPAALFDNRLGTKMGVFSGNIGPIIIDVTPGLGASVATGFSLFSANDDLAFPGRTPQYVTLSGSTNGVDFTQIFTEFLAGASNNWQDQQFFFENSTAYTSYRIELGPTQGATFMQMSEVQIFGTVSNAPPANDTCATAQFIGAGTTSSLNFNATGTDLTACGDADDADVWFRYTAPPPPFSGLIEVNTFGTPALDTTLAVYSVCGGEALACNDNARGSASRVRFTAAGGTDYFIRVAGVGSSTGAFSLTIDENPVQHNDVFIPLAANFNGMAHAGESGAPDDRTGFRSMSDRGLRITGTAGSIDVGTEGGAGIPYTVVTTPGVLDMVHLGNRNATDNARWAFDTVAGAIDPPNTVNDIGVKPDWLSCTDQTAAQITDVCRLGLVLSASSQIGVLYNITNGGSFFDMTLNFADGSSATVSLQGPDWFGNQVPMDPGFGVAYQEQFGVFFGSQDTDIANPGTDLNVVEAVVSGESLQNGLGFDISGRQLTSIAFSNPLNPVGHGIYAVTVRDPASANPAPSCGPVATASSTPSTVGNDGAGVTSLNVSINPGTNPAGSGAMVTVDLSSAGGDPGAMMFDDGLHNDGAAGDNRFGLDFTVPAATATGELSFPYFYSDGQGRTGMGTICVSVVTPPPPPPANDACANATPISGPGIFAFDTTNATPDGPAYCTGNGSGSVWFAFTGTIGRIATIETCGQTGFDTVLAATDACGNPASVCNDDTCGLESRIVLSNSVGQTVLIRVSGFGAGAGVGNIVITEACSIDFNGDGSVNADDLGDFINCYFALPPCDGADFNADGNVNADDLGDFINAYFSGGC